MIYPNCCSENTQRHGGTFCPHTRKTARDPSSPAPPQKNSSLSADKLIPIVFKYSGSSLFGMTLPALSIVYSICMRAAAIRRLLWSVLVFQQSISDIALFFPPFLRQSDIFTLAWYYYTAPNGIMVPTPPRPPPPHSMI